MSTRTTLAAAAQDRKARLAQLKSLKRKQPDTPEYDENGPSAADEDAPLSKRRSVSPNASRGGTQVVAAPDVSTLYLSGRNFDTETRGPKLGFENAPDENAVTLEKQAAEIAAQTKAQAEAEAKANKPIDLFSLQPKKPNWDLKRDLAAKMKILDVRTENAIAKLVRERIEAQKAKALEARREKKSLGNGDSGADAEGEEVGMEGTALVEAMHVREREEEEDARREKELDEELVDGS